MTVMHASTLCRREIALQEGCILHAYKDAVGVVTAMVGHTAAAGPPIPVMGQTYTQAQADVTLAVDLAKTYEPAVARRVTVPLTQYEFDALLLLTYNIGEGNLAKSDLLRCLNAGDKAGAAAGFSHFTTSHGKQLAGLVSRRATERTIFLTGTYPGLKPAAGQTTAEMAHAVTLGQGAKGEAVTHLQTKLKTLGFLTAADGVFGPLTKQAVQAFQRAHGLSDDGIVGLKTGMAIEAALDAKAKAAGAAAGVVLPKSVPVQPIGADGLTAAQRSGKIRDAMKATGPLEPALVLPPNEPGPIKDLVMPTRAPSAPKRLSWAQWWRVLFTGKVS